MKIKRKLFNEGREKSNIPYFIDGVTESGRRYKILVTPEGRGKRQYQDPYKRRSSEELYEEYYSEKDDSYPDDWSEEDKKWEDKLKKGIKRNRREVVIDGAVGGAGIAATIALPVRMISNAVLSNKKTKKVISKLVLPGMIAGGVIGGIKGYKERNKHNLHNKGRLDRYKKMDKDHREWVRKYDSDPSKFIDLDYYKRGGYKPYKKNKDNDSKA